LVNLINYIWLARNHISWRSTIQDKLNVKIILHIKI
jgi:hypothetical protein